MSRFLNELDAKNLLSEYGVPMAKSRVAASKEEAVGIARELEADGLYSFQKEEEQRACEIMEREVNGDG